MDRDTQYYLAALRKAPDSDWSVDFPDVPGCVSAGRTIEDAIENAKEALQGHIDTLYEVGETVPAPSPIESLVVDPATADETVRTILIPAMPPSRTVRVNITMKDRVLADLDAAAKARGISRSGLIARLVEDLEHRA